MSKKHREHVYWTRKEDEYLLANYGSQIADRIADHLGRGADAVYRRKRKLQISRRALRWTDDEIAFLKKHYKSDGAAFVAGKLKRKKRSVWYKAMDIGLKDPKVIKRGLTIGCGHCGRAVYKNQKDFKRSNKHFCSRKCAALSRENRWTEDDLAFLRENHHRLPIADLAKKLNRGYGATHSRANKIGLRGGPRKKVYSKPYKSEAARLKVSNGLKKRRATPEFQRKMALGLRSKPNSKELRLDEILEKHFPSEYKYNGGFDCQVMLGGLIPDFINVNGKKHVVELFGTYWHTERLRTWKQTEFGRKSILSQLGYRCTVIWDTELKDEEAVVEKIKLDLMNDGHPQQALL